MLGFGKRAMQFVDADNQGRLSIHAVERALQPCEGPVIVCAQAGNVNSGSFDPIEPIAAAIAEHRSRGNASTWLHIDGAFGLWARAATSLAHLARGAELADSWATDAHKFLNVPYDCGIALTRHPRALRRAMTLQGAYLSSGAETGAPAPGTLAPELSRRARGFALWAALRQLGSRGIDDLVTRCCAHARLLATMLRREPGVSILNDVVFNQIVAKFEGPFDADPADWTRALVVAIQREGTCYATPTLWRATAAIRFSIVNADTTVADIERSARAVIDVYRASLTAPPGR
jgi:glutamate/tyrosine decarboxylase-like PLP-dependent enzyme